MGHFDFSPLFRHTVGFDRLFDLANTVTRETTQSYPPYNIEKLGDHSYQISMAVAGFAPGDIDVQLQENVLRVTGRVNAESSENDAREFLYHGIAERAFERRFSLADNIKVDGAKMDHGLLHIKLVREVPEEAKPRHITINGSDQRIAS
ncbi:MAG: Hsp20 family protein [Pseudomonadota bacterium]